MPPWAIEGSTPTRAGKRVYSARELTRKAEKASLSASAREIVNATAPVVAENIAKIVSVFYAKLLSENPSLNAFFNKSNQKENRQATALANGVLAAVAHLDNLPAIKGPLLVMAHKHCALGVEPEQYKTVHDTFLAATAEVLGAAVTAEVAAAWSEVLMLVAGALIEQEKEVYEAAEKRKGGWRGIKEFTIVKIREESEDVRSIWFAPKDGGVPPEFSPGQYITVCENPTKEDWCAPRHYTISSDTELRVSVKKIGVMSSHLHSLPVGAAVKLRAPFGTATHTSYFPQASGPEQGLWQLAQMLKLSQAVAVSPLPPPPAHVFVAGGIGITPIRALAAVSAAQGRRVLVVHASGGAGPPALKEEMEAIVQLNPRSEYLVTAHQLDVSQTHVHVCGPLPMTEAVLASLAAIGWVQACVHVDFFGPKGAAAPMPPCAGAS